MTIKFGPGTLIAGFQHPASGSRGSPTTPGISFSMLGAGVTISAALNVYHGVIAGQWVAQTTAEYNVPTGYTFINEPSIGSIGSNAFQNNTWTVTANGANDTTASVLLLPTVAPNDKVMFSFLMTSYPGVAVWMAVGVATEPNLDFYLGQDASAVSVYDQGEVYYDNATLVNPNGPTFQTNGTIVDLLIDNVNQKFWYSVNGSAWIGNYTP